MARTLADMTPEEQQACVGLWCDNLASAAKEPSQVVLACVQGDLCWVLHTDLHGQWSCFPLDRVAPRPDLPRAWTPDGKPVEAQPQTGEVDRGWIYHGDTERTHLPDGTTVRRFVTDWEEQA